MGILKVWAPFARRVDVQIGGSRIEMEQDPGGWWRVDTRFAEHGVDYSFIPDGDNPLPDPRSPWQPRGVHGPSRILDHKRFPWTDGHWQPPPLSSAVIYELHVGAFSPEATFDGVLSRLDYLVDLGVTHVQLMPVSTFSGSRGWGYDGVDLFAPHEVYGGPEGLRRLVDGCHEKGLAVILDVVYNHLGPEGNYLERFGPYFTARHSSPWGKAVNFDGPDSDEVRRFFCDNAIMWLRDYHFDGLRMDAIHAIVDTSAVHILEQLAVEVEALEAEVGRRLTLIAESDLNDPRVVRAREAGGYGIDAQWSDDFHHALHAVLTGEREGYYRDFGSLAGLAKALTNVFVYDGQYSAYRRRSHGRPVETLNGHRFLGYIQNHDQVGNRARGERLSRLVDLGRLKIAAAMVFISPFIPLLFQGEEWGASTPFQYFTDHQDKELGKAVHRGRHEEFSAFGWKFEDIPDPQAPETFQRSRLNWEERDREVHRSILEWYRSLISLRRSTPSLLDGRLDRVDVDYDEDARWFRVIRGPVTMLCNLADGVRRVPIGRNRPNKILLSSDPMNRAETDYGELQPESVVILGETADG
jgi:maltooligosyltrehalose trehalohydrolase